MTPTEKAKQLVDKMYHFKTYNDKESYVAAIGHAKRCATVAAEETKQQLISQLDNEVSAAHAIYWEKVKQEIEKL